MKYKKSSMIMKLYSSEINKLLISQESKKFYSKFHSPNHIHCNSQTERVGHKNKLFLIVRYIFENNFISIFYLQK